jgi:choline dehydrogenase-like flavoprotein
MDHLWVAGGAIGEFDDVPVPPFSLSVPNRPSGIYVIRFRNTIDGPRHKDFLRGFGFQGRSSQSFDFDAPGFGQAYKDGVAKAHNALSLAGFGEMLPRYENFVQLDPNGAVDAWGIPVLKVTMSWSENELAMIPDMANSAAEMLEVGGGKNVRPYQFRNRVPGFGIHEMGVARMGADPKTSVLNQYCQSHDVKNLFVMDAAAFPSGGCQNPTLTIMALAARSSDYLIEEGKKGNL